MNQSATRISPIHHVLDVLGAQWGRAGEAAIALRFDAEDAERMALDDLAICDASVLPKMGIKGPGAGGWLRLLGIGVPVANFQTRTLADGGLIVNISGNEFFLESGPACQTVPYLAAQLGEGESGVYRVERQDATFLLSGTRATEVLAQTCAVDFRQAEPNRAIFTRLAAVSCAVLPQDALVDSCPVYRLWMDYCYAEYLWDNLTTIATELGGRVIGATSFYPQLTGV